MGENNNLFQQAKDAVFNFMNMQGEQSNQVHQGQGSNETDQQAAQNAIQAAHNEASPEEKHQLQQLEQQMKDSNHLK